MKDFTLLLGKIIIECSQLGNVGTSSTNILRDIKHIIESENPELKINYTRLSGFIDLVRENAPDKFSYGDGEDEIVNNFRSALKTPPYSQLLEDMPDDFPFDERYGGKW